MDGQEEDERSFFSEVPRQRTLAGEPAAQPLPFAAQAARVDKRPAPARAPKPHYHGHRDRLRDRFLENGDAALADYELLEALLFRSIPRADTKDLAKTLIQRFGSFAEVLGAPHHLLVEVKGVGASVATDLKLVAAAGARLVRSSVSAREVLSSWTQVIDYCRAAMAFEPREQFRILFLDKKNKLIRDEVQQTGTVDHTPAYPREVLRRAMELSASAIILVHNHPSGDPAPSRADIDMTRSIVEALKPVAIVVHDHIIIGRDGHASLRGMQLM